MIDLCKSLGKDMSLNRIPKIKVLATECMTLIENSVRRSFFFEVLKLPFDQKFGKSIKKFFMLFVVLCRDSF